MHRYGFEKNDTDEPICRTGIKMQTREWTCELTGKGEVVWHRELSGAL